TFSSGQVGVVVVNIGSTACVFDMNLRNFSPGDRYYWFLLKGERMGCDFSRRLKINGQGASGAAGGAENHKDIRAYSAEAGGEEGITISLPGYSAAYILVEGDKR